MSARVYKSFGGESWKRNIVMTPLLVPGFIFGVFFLLNLFVWAKGSSGAVPFGTMLALVLIWFVISVPLSVVGSWVGFKQRVGRPYVPLGRLTKTGCGRADQDEPNPAAGSPDDRQPPHDPIAVPDGNPAIRGDLRGAVLYHDVAVDQQDLLHVWIPVHLLRADDHDGGGDDGSPDVLPAVCGELPVAVAGVCGGGDDGRLCVYQRAHLLGDTGEFWRTDRSGSLCGLLGVDRVCGVHPDR